MAKIAAFKYSLIYVFAIEDERHKGMLKIGKASVDAKSDQWLNPNSSELNDAAKKRIYGEVGTAGVAFKLLHTELAYYKNDDETMEFTDHDVHAVLEASGYHRAEFTDMEYDPQEWFYVDNLEIVCKAIQAVKEERLCIDPAYHKTQEANNKAVITFRDEQRKAIEQTINQFHIGDKMLWNAKMRFGKTLCTLETLRRIDCKRTLIITHRPSVRSGWFEDFNLLPFDSNWFFGYRNIKDPKNLRPEEQHLIKQRVRKIEVLEERASSGDVHYIFFASIQDLRGSWRNNIMYKNKDILNDINWDCLIIDEAHEGTTTNKGTNVIQKIKESNPSIKTLYLSGTPYNIMNNFSSDEIFSWTYEMEQQSKANWQKEHPNEPNPYEGLPKLELFTYRLDNIFEYKRDDETDFFNFAEFFRVKEGKFIHEDDVKRFLQLLCDNTTGTNYPFSTEEFRYSLSHTLWVLPGTEAAYELSKLIKAEDSPLKEYFVINVAGEGDDDQDNSNSVKLVKDSIKANAKTITLTCIAGRLTTGVTVAEWSGVFMLAGGPMTKAASYLQTIFRAQTPTKKGVTPKKQICYVFDFAPDRAIEVINDIIEYNVATDKRKGGPQKSRQEYYEDTLSFLPVIAFDGSREEPYDAITFMKAVGNAYSEHIRRRGYRDKRLFANLDNLTPEQYQALGNLGLKMQAAGYTLTDNGTPTAIVDLSKTGLNGGGQKPSRDKKDKKRPKGSQIPKSQDAHKEKRKKSHEAFVVLSNIFIRLPMLIFGCDIEGNELTIDTLLENIDEESWNVFLPDGVEKEDIRTLINLGIIKEERFTAAASDTINEIKNADTLPIEDRIRVIAKMIGDFRFPDKETVLTPWWVVNMHLSRTIGGYDFFDEKHKISLRSPRYVENAHITKEVFHPSAKILEINSKSGLYPLWIAYSFYREAMNSGWYDNSEEGHQEAWNHVVARNVYVLCMSSMAAKITRRILLGYRNGKSNVVPYLKTRDIVQDIKSDPDKVISRLRGFNNFWGNNKNDMKFNAVVGNPPYNEVVKSAKESTNGQKPTSSIFHHFQNISDKLAKYTSLIYPGKRWIHRCGKGVGLKKFGHTQINEKSLVHLWFFPEANDVFDGVEIADGISIVLKDSTKKSCGFEYTYSLHDKEMTVTAENPGDSLFSLNPLNDDIIRNINDAVKKYKFSYLHDSVLPRSIFSIESDFVQNNPDKVREYNEGDVLSKDEIKLFCNDKAGKAGRGRWFVVKRSEITTGQEHIDRWQVTVSSANAGGQKRSNQIDIADNRSAFGRSRVALGSFETEEEAKNFLKYCSSQLIRFAFTLTDESLTSLAEKVPDLLDYKDDNNFIDYSKDIDSQLYSLFNIDESQVNHIKSILGEDAKNEESLREEQQSQTLSRLL